MATRQSHFGALLSLLLATACSSTLKIESTPVQAEVSVEDKNGEKKSLGQTPLALEMSKLREVVGEDAAGGEYVTVVVEKAGFGSQRLALPRTRFGTMVTQVQVKLKEGDQPKQNQAAADVLNSFFLAQKFALNKEFERAQAEIDKILAVAPDFARAFSMRASIYYVQKNLPESVKWYEMALKADPKMDEAVKMIAKINGGKNGARGPATTKGGAR